MEATALLASAPDNAYIIKATENKIVIAGKTEQATLRAMKRFLANSVEASKSSVIKMEVGYEEKGTVDLGSTLFDNFAEMIPEVSLDLAIPQYVGASAPSYSYETMIKLSHNGDANGTLIASHATLYSDEDGYKMYRSYDNGDTWEHYSTAFDTLTSALSDCYMQPCLFELPKDMGDFKEGTLFLGGCSRGSFPDGGGMSAVTLYYSEDVGLTWKAYHVLAMGGTAQAREGVWEPFFYYDEETGRVFCFYSDETDPKYNQVLGFKYTTDMKNWSEIKYAVANEQPELRPGMIAISKMNNGEYIMTYEMVGFKGNPIYYKKTKKIDDWGDLSDYGKLIITDDGKSLGSAPWNAWTPAGGEKGIVFMGADHKVTGESIFGTGTDLFLSFDYGETWTAIENPIPFAPTKCGKTSYSPYIGFSYDGKTMYYISGSDYGECNQTMFARIKIC